MIFRRFKLLSTSSTSTSTYIKSVKIAKTSHQPICGAPKFALFPSLIKAQQAPKLTELTTFRHQPRLKH